MDLLTPVSVLILWSSLPSINAFAEDLTPLSSVAIPSKALVYESSLNNIDPSFNVQIENMPAVQSQDTVGSCFGCGAATIVQKFLCDSDPEYKKLNLKCNSLPRDKVVSQLSMIAWADTNETKPKEQPKELKEIPGQTKNHTNIKLYDDTNKFSSGANALKNSTKMFKFMPESCYPFDQLVSKYGNTDSTLFENVYKRTKLLYESMKFSTEAENGQCNECINQLNSNFNTTFTQETLISALNKDTFGEFLYTLIFKNCKSILSDVRPQFNSIPGEASSTLPKTEVFNNIKKILDKKKPILISKLCLEVDSKTDKCISSHSTVISGYRRVCPSKNFNDHKCKTQLKIHNCWGEDWQKANNGGWLNAEDLIVHLNYGNSYIIGGELSWLE